MFIKGSRSKFQQVKFLFQRLISKTRSLLSKFPRGFCETKLTGLFYFLPWVAKLAPEWSGWNNYLNSIPPTKALMEELLANYKDTFSPDDLRDFTDAYIKEIYNTTDPSSTFYREKGCKNVYNFSLTFN